ncbi:MAG: type II toxin-antitoxin system prevent-host-death family antitoxin [Deltaproteobacteria bacterium]|jgi:prevent-host-death family protein|nr:type II toxin-antitoxin system prevent-host-death family antitoxin [Deltaproteobacteria bacterium]
MYQVNIHEAKTHLSRLVDMAAQGQTVIIARAGKPIAKLESYNCAKTRQRLGFLQGRFGSPAPVKEVGKDDIAAMFRIVE